MFEEKPLELSWQEKTTEDEEVDTAETEEEGDEVNLNESVDSLAPEPVETVSDEEEAYWNQ